MPDMMIYGSYGYTGALIAREALNRGLKPVLAGRNATAVAEQAAALGLEHRCFALEDANAVKEALAGMRAVIHCAGPFSRTAKAMAVGCMAAGAHYLDITGEIEVFERLAGMNDQARDEGVMLLPGAGFDVVPSDCLAAQLKRSLPAATRLVLAFCSPGRPSHGTMLTALENLHRGGVVRRAGRLTPVPSAWKTRKIDFAAETRTAVTIPWGDVSTAYHSTGIPNIEVYMAMTPGMRRMSLAMRYMGWIMGTAPVRRWMERKVAPGGPGEEDRARSYCLLWGKAMDDAGNRVEARLRTPDGYTLTARSAVAIAQRILEGDLKPGFQTPSLAYGADFVLGIEGVTQ
jgi:short subunit dehydrogenase-like uncharacterized protein